MKQAAIASIEYMKKMALRKQTHPEEFKNRADKKNAPHTPKLTGYASVFLSLINQIKKSHVILAGCYLIK